MTIAQIKNLLAVLGFQDGGNIWRKTYGGIVIALDFERERIVYPHEIRRGDETTSHFDALENFVVLECVDRLLCKGYRAEDIELERRYKLGRKSKSSGKADITVYGRDGRALIVIECKTWGIEFEAEKEQMRKDGGQLFSYWVQDRAARYLCLYTSRQNSKAIEFENNVLAVFDTPEEREAQTKKPDALLTWAKAADTKDLVLVWETKSKRSFTSSGIFEDDFEAYNPGFVPLRIGDLKDFKAEDKGRVFNEFEEILRHNNISDRSNAFNRFISLVLAKIADENRPGRERAHFQYKPGVDTDEDLHERLQALYKAAMRSYLHEEVVNYSLAEIEAIIACFPRQTSKDDLRRIYRELKFFSNNEFAFKEVYNEQLFRANAVVLEEIVRLFQPFRFRYDRRAQFLGEFFELMLESGYKQSEGQFFTPTPIARFLLSSLPLEKIVREKAARATGEIRDSAPLLPTVIDYACGSGHFVTESIEEIQQLLARLPDDVHPRIKALRDAGTTWAGDYLCGIEKDYRLARTSQVACFMHGDGEARIIFGDGLEEHGERLPTQKFDVLVANPPYTIKDFKKHIRKDRLPGYTLLDSISDDSDDIEVLFVERATQLLREGGYAALILPSTILSAGNYARVRKLLLQKCWLRAVVEPGKETFDATKTTTVILFLQRRPDKHSTDFNYIAEDLIQKNIKRDLDWCDSKALLNGYCAHRGLDLVEYSDFLARKPSGEFRSGEFYSTYRRWFDECSEKRELEKRASFKKLNPKEQATKIETLFFDLIFEIEADKFHHWMLLHDQPLLVVKSGQETAAQREFLGYKFSDRRGYKGLDLERGADGKPITKLYDEGNPDNLDKANAHIRRALSGESPAIVPPALEKHVGNVRLVDGVDFERVRFDMIVALGERAAGPIRIESKYPLEQFTQHATLEYGDSLPARSRKPGEYPVVGSNGVVGFHDVSLIKGPAIVVGRKGSAGKVTWVEKSCFPIDTTFYVKLHGKLRLRFLYYLLLEMNLESAAQKFGVPGLNREDVHHAMIPIPPSDIQDKAIKELASFEKNTKYDLSDLKNAETAMKNAAKVRSEILRKYLT